MKEWSRREWLELVLAASAGAAVPLPGLLAQGRPQTPSMILGPFYPLIKPLDQDGDLTRLRGHRDRAAGQIVHLSGRVLNERGEPVRNARVEIWQTNMHGRYAHPSDPNTKAPLDPNFQGFGVQTTDAQGWYRFTTVRPAAYPSTRAGLRAPHIHFDVQGRTDRKVTQMFFPGEPLNAQDELLQTVRTERRDALVAKLERAEANEIVARWDIILANG